MFTRASEVRVLNEPGQEVLQRDLPCYARNYYRRFANRHRDDPRVRRELTRAYWRLGMINALLGDVADAERQYRVAVEHLEHLYKANRSDSNY
jgi:hypothetical protein